MADVESVGRVEKIVKSDPARKYIVVSAPGKCNGGAKVTDLLIQCFEEIKNGGNCDRTFPSVAARYRDIYDCLGSDILDKTLFSVKDAMEKSGQYDFCVSRGEYLSAYFFALKTGFGFVDAAELLRFDKYDGFNAAETDKICKKRLRETGYIVIPGFYGSDENGNIVIFSRGGSDITGSLVAAAVKADIYENWTDVDGILNADPRIVQSPEIISSMTYGELREMSYLGAAVMHPDALVPLIKTRTPLAVRNTFRPETEGTLITSCLKERSETGLSYLSQMLCLTVQNFLSGAVGIAVLYALMRGFTRKECRTVGNCWADITRVTLFMLPVCFIGAVLLISQGVPQTMSGSVSYVSLEGAASKLYLGPAASQIIIKQLFTNGGGFWGVNSAYPFENPTAFSNLIECLSLLWIPAGLCFTFGKAVLRKDENGVVLKQKNQGVALLKVMSILFIAALVVCTVFEYIGGNLPEGVSAIGNMEGKESRFGAGTSALWAVATTSASNGSVNAMHDSFTSLGGMIPMFLMMLGEIVYGGVGCGLSGMIAFAILTVFIGGLMVGRTPEYIGKKIGSFDMKMVCLVILTPVLCLLLGTAGTVLMTEAPEWLTNSGAHGFSEILYAFASMAGNNGSAFAGFNANTPWTNVVGGLVMLFVRFIPMFAVIFLAGSLGSKKIVPESDGTLSTTNGMFMGLLIAVILIVGALSFFPALALGPIAEYVG